MNLTEPMIDILHALRRIESRRIVRILDAPAAELGNRLIEIYYRTYNLQTRELIMRFMDHAGVVWMRKLITRDSSSIPVSKTQFTSIEGYLAAMPANDASHVQSLVAN